MDVENGENLPVHQRKIGYVFQDARLFPHYNVKGNLRYGMKHVSREDFDYIVQLLGIEPLLKRYPLTLSGGEKQRVAIARALALNPKLIVADEPTSALDVSVRAQVLNLLADLKKELNLAMVFISHDIQTVRQVSDRIVVMYGGQILETGSTEDIFNHPTVDYTRKLLGVAPSLL